MQRQQLAHVAVVVDDQNLQHRIASPGEPTSYLRSLEFEQGTNHKSNAYRTSNLNAFARVRRLIAKRS
jgi:hypothetical protein